MNVFETQRDIADAFRRIERKDKMLKRDLKRQKDHYYRVIMTS